MKRDDTARLHDIIDACDAIVAYVGRGDLDDSLVFDAIRVRLIEIGEAVKYLSAESLTKAPDVPWREVAGMRDHLTHHYFDTAHAIIAATIRDDIPAIRNAALHLLEAR